MTDNRGPEIMPVPQFTDIISTENIPSKRVGIEGLTLSGGLRRLVYDKTLVGNLEHPTDRMAIAGEVARLYLVYGIEAAIGPAVDLARSSPDTGEVIIIGANPSEIYRVGVYVDPNTSSQKEPSIPLQDFSTEEEFESQIREYESLRDRAEGLLPRYRTIGELATH